MIIQKFFKNNTLNYIKDNSKLLINYKLKCIKDNTLY